MTPPPVVEQRLRDALGALASSVEPEPDAFARAQAEWRRRERRRRRWGTALAALLVLVADVVGLWALRQVDTAPPVVFDGPAPIAPLVDGPPSAPLELP